MLTRGEPIERLSFDSDTASEANGMDRYRMLYAGGADVTDIGPAPRAAVTGWRLDGAILYERRLHDVSHARGAQRVRDDGFTHVTATLVLGGELAVSGGGGWRTLRAGEAVLFEMTDEMASRAANAHLITVSLAPHRVETMALDRPIHAHVLPASATRLLRAYAEALLAELPRLEARAAAAATTVLCTLLELAVDQTTPAHRREHPTDTDADRMWRLRVLIDEHLTDAGFDANAASRLSDLSRATLYRLTLPHGGVAALIRAQRLARVRKLLLADGGRHPLARIAELAGWRSESHLSRAFKERFGVRPGEYRDRSRRLFGTAPVEALLSWSDELR